jgi:hypothetical protein
MSSEDWTIDIAYKKLHKITELLVLPPTLVNYPTNAPNFSKI